MRLSQREANERVDALVPELGALTLENTKLRGVLKNMAGYAAHFDCEIEVDGECTCGLSAMLKEIGHAD